MIDSLIVLTITLLLTIETLSQTKEAKRESIFNRVVTIEPKLIPEIPAVFRWCDRIDGLKKQRINVGDAGLYVEEEGAGTPLVLINGGPGGTHHYFHPWFSRAKQYARVIYYDQRGCGLTDFKPGEKGYSVDQAVGDLDAIRRSLNVDKWVLLGYSYGGFLAQYYTVRHPDHVAGLILLGASTGMWTDDGPSRQDEFLSQQENDRLKTIRQELIELLKAKTLSREDFTKLLIYNNFLNGDWKRQHFYKPSPERMAQIARYEWVNDNDFNSIMNQSADQIDLTGAFKDNPIPTLMLEGKWDLTWVEKKKQLLQDNHPHAKMVLFENAAHGIYDEEPEKFFAVLEEFITTLPGIEAKALAAYPAQLVDWEKSFQARPESKIRQVGWGLFSSKKLAAEYQREWLVNLTEYSDYLRIGFALYDVEKYSEALYVFEQMEPAVSSDARFQALALIWQGHVLDLLVKRDEAIARYQQVAAMNLNDLWQHDQYGLRYKLSPYAKERMVAPFKRVENRDID